jgi:hypothetical protein
MIASQAEIDAYLSGGSPAPDADGIPRDHLGRYILPSLDGTVAAGHWSRASTVASTLDDQTGLTSWKLRTALSGIAQRPDLVALAASAYGDKAVLDEVAEKAHIVANGDASANLGTALHAALVHATKHPEQAPEDFAPTFAGEIRAAAVALSAAGLRILPQWAERVVLNEADNVAGTVDHLAEYVDGSGPVVMLDIKTGKLDYSGLKFSIQLASYCGATHARNFTDNTWEPLPAIRRDYALILHVPIGCIAAQLYVVPLALGRAGLELANKVREIRKAGRKAIQPYKLGVIPAAQLGMSYVVPQATVTELHAEAKEVEQQLDAAELALDTIQTSGTLVISVGPDAGLEHATQVTGKPVQQVMPDGRMGTWVKTDGGWSLQPNEVQATGTAAVADTSEFTDAEQDKITELCKMPKDALAVLAGQYGVADTKRYKIKVATDVVRAMRSAVGSPAPVIGAQPSAHDQAVIDAFKTELAELAAQAQAPTLPDHPVFAAAQPQANPFTTPQARAAVAPVDPVIAEIEQANSRTDLAGIWQQCQRAGSGGWTTERQAAADARLAQLGI